MGSLVAERRAEDSLDPQRLLTILAEIGAAADLDAALVALARGAITLLRGHQGAVRAYDVAGRGRHVALWVWPDGSVEPDAHPEPPPGSVAVALKLGGPALIVDDLWSLDPDLSDEERHRKRRGMRSSVAVPIQAGEQRIGSLHVDHPAVEFFSTRDLVLARTLASHAGVVIERARQAARREVDEALRLSERRYRTLIEQSPLSTQVFAPDGSAVAANAAWERLWGTTRDQLAGYNILHDPQLRANGALAQIERAFAGEAVSLPPVRYDPALTGKPGRPRWVAAQCYPVKDEAGAVMEVVLVLDDVTTQLAAEKALRHSEARYRELFENANDIVYTHDLQGTFTSINRAGERLLGYTARDLLGRNATDIVAPESIALVREMIARKIAGEAPSTTYELEVITKDGRRAPLEVSSRLIYADGQPVGIQGIARDVSERRRAEEALRESEERYRRLVEFAPEAIAVHRQGTLVYVNPAGAALVGASSPQALLGRSIFDFVHPDYRATVVERMRAVQEQGGLGAGMEERFLRLDGTPIDVEVVAIPTTYDGAPASQVIVRDITARKRAETEIASLHAVATALSRAATPAQVAEAVLRAGYPTAGAAGGIVVSLDATETHFEIIGAEGYPPEAIAPWQRFSVDLDMPVADAARAREPILMESAGEVAARYPNLPVLRTSRASGALAALPLVAEDRLVGAMSLRYMGSRTFAPDDRAFLRALADLCAVALDRARLFSQAQEQRARAEQTAREREAALADVQAAIQARDQFLSISAHELLTPVTTLRGHSQFALHQLARQGTLDPERTAQALRTIDWAASRLTLLVRQLLDVSRLRSGKMSIDRRPTDLVRLVRDVASAAQTTTERHTITVHAPAAAAAEVDPLRVEQVLNNLVANAIKYSPGGGPIGVDVGVEPGAVRIAVEDRGAGIAPEHRPRIFEPYFQAHAASHQSGMGLGLYIAKEIVELHGGTIAAEFPEHGGSRFVVTLPVASAAHT